MTAAPTYQPPRSPDTLAGRIYQIVAASPQGVRTEELQQQIQDGYTYHSIIARCHTMVARGQLRKEYRTKPGTRRVVAFFFLPAPDQPLVARKTPPLSLKVRQAMERHPDATLPEIAWYAGVPTAKTRKILQQFVALGEAELTGPRNRLTYRLVDDDDDTWTPRPFVSSIRARSLGLPLGRAA